MQTRNARTLRFWAAHGNEVDQRLGEIDEDDTELARLTNVRQEIVEHIDRCIDSADPTVQRLAIKTLCSLGTNGKALDRPTFVCGTVSGVSFEEAGLFHLRSTKVFGGARIDSTHRGPRIRRWPGTPL